MSSPLDAADSPGPVLPSAQAVEFQTTGFHPNRYPR